jgi:hypothetical protein
VTGNPDSKRPGDGTARICSGVLARMSASVFALSAAISLAPVASAPASVGVKRPSIEPGLPGAKPPPLSPMTL